MRRVRTDTRCLPARRPVRRPARRELRRRRVRRRGARRRGRRPSSCAPGTEASLPAGAARVVVDDGLRAAPAPRDGRAPRAPAPGRRDHRQSRARPRPRTSWRALLRPVGAHRRHGRQPQQRDRRAAHAPRASNRAPRWPSSRWRCAAPARSASSRASRSPDVGVITNVAPVHLELVGTVEDVAAAKAELIEELMGGTAVVPVDEPLLERHLHRHRGRVVTFGAPSADVQIVVEERRGESTHALLDAFGHRARTRLQLHRRPLPARRAGRARRVRRARLPPGPGRGGRRAGRLQRPARRPLLASRRRPAPQRRLQRQPRCR